MAMIEIPGEVAEKLNTLDEKTPLADLQEGAVLLAQLHKAGYNTAGEAARLRDIFKQHIGNANDALDAAIGLNQTHAAGGARGILALESLSGTSGGDLASVLEQEDRLAGIVEALELVAGMVDPTLIHGLVGEVTRVEKILESPEMLPAMDGRVALLHRAGAALSLLGVSAGEFGAVTEALPGLDSVVAAARATQASGDPEALSTYVAQMGRALDPLLSDAAAMEIIVADTEVFAKWVGLAPVMDAVAGNPTAFSAVVGNRAAWGLVVGSRVASEAVANSNDAMRVVVASEVASREVFASEVASREVFASEVASREVFASEVARREVFASEVARREVFASEVASREVFASEVASRELFASEVASREVFSSTVALAELMKNTAGQDAAMRQNTNLQNNRGIIWDTLKNNTNKFVRQITRVGGPVATLNPFANSYLNSIVIATLGYYNDSSSRTNMIHRTGGTAASMATISQPSYVSRADGVSFKGCTFTETKYGYGYLAIEVWQVR